MHRETIRTLWGLLERTHKRQIMILIFMMLISGLTELCSVAAVPAFVMSLSQANDLLHRAKLRPYLDALHIETPGHLAVVAGLGLVTIFLLRGTIYTYMIWRQSSTISAISQNLSSRLFKGYLIAPYTLHLSRNTAEYAQILLDEVKRATENYLLPLLTIVMNLGTTVALITLVLIVDPFSAVGVGVVTAGAVFLFMRARGRRARKHGDEISRRSVLLRQAMNEGLGSLKHVKLRGLEAAITHDFDHHARIRRLSGRALIFNGSLPKPVFETAAVTALVGLAFAMMLQGRSLAAIVPTLALIGAVAVRMLPMLNHLTQMFLEVSANDRSVHHLSEDLHRFTSVTPDLPVQTEFAPLNGDIVLENVTFRYPDQAVDALKDVSLSIPAHTSVAFVGPTGSGKSTAVDTILGLLPPTSGRVTVDGEDIAENPQRWQRGIGYIPQSIFLTDASTRRNVALGVPDEEIDDDVVWRALEIAQLAEMVGAHPQGLAAPVGERGVRLSGGERQRIGIARALYDDPAILVLDEATAALDNVTEAKLMSAIGKARGNRTLIMIAHRLSTVRDCDIIFFLKEGRLVASGSYDQLMSSCPEFVELAQRS
jgi:ATP-binding cassette subfamily C protein